jgi:hypothetical protein
VSRMYPESKYVRYRNRQLIDSGLLGPVRILAGREPSATVPRLRNPMESAPASKREIASGK